MKVKSVIETNYEVELCAAEVLLLQCIAKEQGVTRSEVIRSFLQLAMIATAAEFLRDLENGT